MYISIVAGMIISGYVAVVVGDSRTTMIVSILSGYAIGYFFALNQKN